MAYKRTGRYAMFADELDLIIDYYENDGIIAEWMLEADNQPIWIRIVDLVLLIGCILMWIFLDEVPFVKVPLLLFKVFASLLALWICSSIDAKYGAFWRAFGATGSKEWQTKRLYEKYDLFTKKKENLVKYIKDAGADLTDIRDRMKARNNN